MTLFVKYSGIVDIVKLILAELSNKKTIIYKIPVIIICRKTN